MLKKILLSGAVLLSSANSFSAAVELNGWGTSSIIKTYSDCVSQSYCDGTIVEETDGAVGASESSLSLTNDYGEGLVEASLNGPGYLPLIKAKSLTGEESGVFASGYAIQHYTYIGRQPRTLELEVYLDGNISGDAALEGAVVVIKGDQISWHRDLPTLVYESVNSDDVLAYERVYIRSSVINPVTYIDVELQPGDTFFVRADLRTGSKTGDSADAYNSYNALSLRFDDHSKLIATSNSEPSSGSVSAIGLLWERAYVDGRFSEHEKTTIVDAGRILGLSRRHVNEIKLEIKGNIPPL